VGVYIGRRAGGRAWSLRDMLGIGIAELFHLRFRVVIMRI
jgi:hypothetical protein